MAKPLCIVTIVLPDELMNLSPVSAHMGDSWRSGLWALASQLFHDAGLKCPVSAAKYAHPDVVVAVVCVPDDRWGGLHPLLRLGKVVPKEVEAVKLVVHRYRVWVVVLWGGELDPPTSGADALPLGYCVNVIQLRWFKDHDSVLDPEWNVTGEPDAVDQ